jgi:hypothetical protein
MGELRKPFFVIALVAIALVVLVELGAPLFLGGGNAALRLQDTAGSLDVTVPNPGEVTEPPGTGIPYLALIDVIALYTAILMATSLVASHRLQGRIQGILTLIGSILLILTALVLAIVAIIKLLIMVSLFFAAPFGTIAYLVVWGFFPRPDATVLLSLIMFLKLVYAGSLLAAHQRFLQNKGLILLLLTSLLATIITSFLHGLVPIILVSITDTLAAIITAILAIIWALILLIGSIPAIVKALRATAS